MCRCDRAAAWRTRPARRGGFASPTAHGVCLLLSPKPSRGPERDDLQPAKRSLRSRRRPRPHDDAGRRHGGPRRVDDADEDVDVGAQRRPPRLLRRRAPTRWSIRSSSPCPGTLPVMNQAAVEMSRARRAGAGRAKIAGSANWDRKSYFYPDLPKNYQISQYDRPALVIGGTLDVGTPESPPADPHDPGPPRGGRRQADARAARGRAAPGQTRLARRRVVRRPQPRRAPRLLELVSEPDVKTADEAGRLLRAAPRAGPAPGR